MSEVTPFIDGLSVKEPHEKAPDYVKACMSINKAKLAAWLSEKDGEWINFDVLVSKKGSWYCKINDYKKTDTPPPMNAPISDEQIPF